MKKSISHRAVSSSSRGDRLGGEHYCDAFLASGYDSRGDWRDFIIFYLKNSPFLGIFFFFFENFFEKNNFGRLCL